MYGPKQILPTFGQHTGQPAPCYHARDRRRLIAQSPHAARRSTRGEDAEMTSNIANSAALAAVLMLAVSSHSQAQTGPALSTCNTAPRAAACAAVRGDRADGWA